MQWCPARDTAWNGTLNHMPQSTHIVRTLWNSISLCLSDSCCESCVRPSDFAIATGKKYFLGAQMRKTGKKERSERKVRKVDIPSCGCNLGVLSFPQILFHCHWKTSKTAPKFFCQIFDRNGFDYDGMYPFPPAPKWPGGLKYCIPLIWNCLTSQMHKIKLYFRTSNPHPLIKTSWEPNAQENFLCSYFWFVTHPPTLRLMSFMANQGRSDQSRVLWDVKEEWLSSTRWLSAWSITYIDVQGRGCLTVKGCLPSMSHWDRHLGRGALSLSYLLCTLFPHFWGGGIVTIMTRLLTAIVWNSAKHWFWHLLSFLLWSQTGSMPCFVSRPQGENRPVDSNDVSLFQTPPPRISRLDHDKTSQQLLSTNLCRLCPILLFWQSHNIVTFIRSFCVM